MMKQGSPWRKHAFCKRENACKAPRGSCQRYIKTGIFAIELSGFIKNAFEIRNDSDYQDFYVISRDDVAAQIANATTFLAAVEDYIAVKFPADT